MRGLTILGGVILLLWLVLWLVVRADSLAIHLLVPLGLVVLIRGYIKS